MEMNRSGRIISIIALIVAVIGLSLGFANYATNLDITSIAATDASNNPNLFKVEFETTKEGTGVGSTTKNITGTTTGDATSEATAELNGTTVSGLNATFKKVGDKVTYNFYVRNLGQFQAYLNGITFADAPANQEAVTTYVQPSNSSISCSINETLTSDQTTRFQNVCNSIKYTLNIDDGTTYTSDEPTINNKGISAESGYHKVKVEIIYDGSSTDIFEKDITVSLGAITLNYGLND